MWKWLTTRGRTAPSSRRNHLRRLGPENLESRALCAAQPLDSAVCGLGDVGSTESVAAAEPIVASPVAARAVATAVTDDRFEQNDSITSAANLGAIRGTQTFSQLALADRADWYKFSVPATGAAGDQVTLDFRHSQGDLDLALYSSNGWRLRRSDGVTNREQVSLAGLPAGTYYAVVYGYSGAVNPNYTLTIASGAGGTTTSGGATTSNGSTTAAGGSTPSTGTASNTSGFNIEFAFNGLTAAQQAIFEQAAQRWESIIVGDLPNATYGGRVVDDLLISATATAIDGRGNVLGEAAPDRFRNGSLLPYHGTMEFDSADLAAMQADGSLLSVIEHEMGHVLGVGTLWAAKGLLVGAGTSSPRYVGANAVAEYASIFGVNATSVPVEAGGGAGTRDAHWRDSLFGSELMTGYVGPGTSLPLSRITVASLADLGYSVRLAAADSYAPPASTTRVLAGAGVGGSGASLVAPTTSVAESSATRTWRDARPLAPRTVDAVFRGRDFTRLG